MRQSKRVAKFMNRFFLGPRKQQSRIWRQAIELLTQTARRNQRGATANLGFAENKSKNWNEKIQVRHSENLGAIRGPCLTQSVQKER